MKKLLTSIGSSSLSIISSTIIIVPFILLIQLSNNKNLLTLLPFLLFYIFRMTGLFLIRGLKTTLNSQELLHLSILSGLAGCLLILFAFSYFPFYIIAGILLGFSGAWLPPSYTTLQNYFQQSKQKHKNNPIMSLALFTLIGVSMFLPVHYRFGVTFLFYGLMFLLSLYFINQLPEYKYDAHELEETPYYLLVFGIFFVLLFLLRSSKLSLNSTIFTYFLYGFIALTLVIMILLTFYKTKLHIKTPNSLLFLTLLNGAIGNYLFLFSSLYAHGYYGKNSLPLKVYLPYALGILLSGKVIKFLSNHLKEYAIAGVIFGLMIVMLTPFFSIGIFFTSLFKTSLNSYLTQNYVGADYLAQDRRIWVKYSIQNIGSISHQFFLMLIGAIVMRTQHLPVNSLFIMTNTDHPTASNMAIMSYWNHVATAVLIVSIILYCCFFLKKNRDQVTP